MLQIQVQVFNRDMNLVHAVPLLEHKRETFAKYIGSLFFVMADLNDQQAGLEGAESTLSSLLTATLLIYSGT